MKFIRDLNFVIIVATDVLASNDARPSAAGRAQATQIYIFLLVFIIRNKFTLAKQHN